MEFVDIRSDEGLGHLVYVALLLIIKYYKIYYSFSYGDLLSTFILGNAFSLLMIFLYLDNIAKNLISVTLAAVYVCVLVVCSAVSGSVVLCGLYFGSYYEP